MISIVTLYLPSTALEAPSVAAVVVVEAEAVAPAAAKEWNCLCIHVMMEDPTLTLSHQTPIKFQLYTIYV